MVNLIIKKIITVLLSICMIILLSSCKNNIGQVIFDVLDQKPEKRVYYSKLENYVEATGTVSYIEYGYDYTELYIGFSDLTPSFDDTTFKIVGKNLLITKKNGIDEKIKLGDTVNFITAPRYFGDGYIMPIVAISVNGETLLEFEDGFKNYLNWLGADIDWDSYK